MKTIGDWLKIAKKQIAMLDAELIALAVFAPDDSTDRSWLVSHDDVEITTEMQKKATVMLERRRRGEPLAYILGKKAFYGRDFLVTADVLIPRPETEILIDLIKGLKLPKQPSFLEIGTGSGCIAITLALEFPQSYVLATDVSSKALDVAYRNDLAYEGRVEFMQSNLLHDVTADEGRFDVLVANLPYVDPRWEWLDKDSLDYEPRRALYVEKGGGLALYERLLRELKLRQGRGGFGVDYVVLEADPCQHLALVKIAERQGLICLRTSGYGLLFERRQRQLARQRMQRYLLDIEPRLAKANHQDNYRQDAK